MNEIGLTHWLVLSAILMSIGAIGVVVRRNVLIIFMSVELMLNAANLAFVAGSALLLPYQAQTVFEQLANRGLHEPTTKSPYEPRAPPLATKRPNSAVALVSVACARVSFPEANDGEPPNT